MCFLCMFLDVYVFYLCADFFLHVKEQFSSYMFLAENHKIQNGRHFIEENVNKIIFVFSS